MGKVLIIKDADFSAVAAEKIIIDGAKIVKSSYTSTAYRYISTRSDGTGRYAYFEYSSGSVYFYPIQAGQYVVIPKQQAAHTVGLVNDTNVSTTQIINIMTDGGIIQKAATSAGDAVLLAKTNGYVVVYESSLYPWPEGIYITTFKPLDRILDETSSTLSINKNMAVDTTFTDVETPEGKRAARFYTVFPGEKVHITANASRAVQYAFLKYNKYLYTGTNTFSQGTLSTLAVGESIDIAVQKHCLLYIQAYDGSADTFPASLSVTGAV